MTQASEQQRIREGCKCKQCFGLAEEMILNTGHDFGLEHAPGHGATPTRLRVVTAGQEQRDAATFDGPMVVKACTGGMLCDCKPCSRERKARIKQARKAAQRRQPWEPRRARQAA